MRTRGYFKDPVNEGKPRFKARHRTVPAFTIPDAVRMDADRLRVPKVGWLRTAGSNPYADCKPLTVRVRMEGTERYPKWYAHVCYAVSAEQVKQPAEDGALGLDRNVGQATDSDGTVYAMPDTDRLDARIARKQRDLSRKHGGRRTRGRSRTGAGASTGNSPSCTANGRANATTPPTRSAASWPTPHTPLCLRIWTQRP